LDPVINIVGASILAWVFVAAALHKLRAPAGFAAVLAAYGLLPAPAVPVIARAIPAVELGIALLLVIPAWSKAGAPAAALLLAVYTSAIGINLLRGRRTIDCGCGGQRQPLSEWLLIRNLVLIGLALAVMIEPQARALTWLDWTTIVPAAAAGCLFHHIVERLLANAGLLWWLRHG
jgi:hypothetical protein